MSGRARQYDHVVVGGGLSGGLIALALVQQRPGARVALVERAPRLGGNHTWSFHDSDLDADGWRLVAPLVAHRWDGYEVAFPDGRRRLEHGYAAISSARFGAAVRARLERADAEIVVGAAAVEVGAHHVVLAGGRRLDAAVVVDARDSLPGDEGRRAGYQKFVGLEVQLPPERAGALGTWPQLMDATVAQADGFRFVYVLPFAPDRVLVEDTTFSNHALLDLAAARARVWRYLAARGLGDARAVREEHGVLPMPWAGGAAPSAAPLRAGMAGGWFHPATGYSLPVAVRLAAVVAREEPRHLADAVAALWRAHDRQARFGRLLNRLLFRAVAPDRRWTVFARFFGLPLPTIQRFFRLQTSGRDRARILCGRPAAAGASPVHPASNKEAA